jgi:hypothetical protein
VNRSRRTIIRWKRSGMPMTLDAHGRRVVDEEVLLARLREALGRDPIHQARLRAKRREQEEQMVTLNDVDEWELPGRSDRMADVEPGEVDRG